MFLNLRDKTGLKKKGRHDNDLAPTTYKILCFENYVWKVVNIEVKLFNRNTSVSSKSYGYKCFIFHFLNVYQK